VKAEELLFSRAIMPLNRAIRSDDLFSTALNEERRFYSAKLDEKAR
jgi:hypothetical protein